MYILTMNILDIDPKVIVQIFIHPKTGRFFNESKMQYEYLIMGEKVATASIDIFEQESPEKQLELNQLIWDEIFKHA